MSVLGSVRNGVVVLDASTFFPEGARVRVELVEEEIPNHSIVDRWEKVIGMAEGLPPDLARNHDHYLHGRPRNP
jgi:hypothetical protein